jgi:hypothetical protein
MAMFTSFSALATVGAIDDWISLGRDLRFLHSCCDLPLRDLQELTGMDVRSITPRKLFARIKAHLSSSWEELADDNILCHLMRVAGREVALSRVVIPLVILLEMWMRPGERIVTLYHHLQTVRIRVDRWPKSTYFSLLVEHGMEPTITQAHGPALKKISRAFLALPSSVRGSKIATCLEKVG